jgi:hypothetical protein
MTRPDPDRVRAVHEFVISLAQQAALISLEDAVALVDEFGFMHAAMPILDPTGYRKALETSDGHEALAKAFLTFRRALERIKEQG